MNVYVILNPYANRWAARRQAGAVEAAFRAAGLGCELVITERAGHGAVLAEEAAGKGGYDAVVAAGGDSTVSEVANGLIRAAGDGPTRPLGVLPLGTGNDMSDMAGVPRELAAAVAVVKAGETRQIDAGRLFFDGQLHYFDNNCAAAMEPLVTIESLKMKRLSGNIRYIVALVRAMIKLKAWHMRLDWDGGSYDGPAYLLSVCNSARTGGVFYMAPGAQTDDGFLDLVFAPELPKLDVLKILPRLFKGTHVHHPRITFGRTRRLSVTSRPGTPVHADGEVLAESAATLEYDILPGKLTVLAPTGKQSPPAAG
jgi:YegS/Rv2252/BmrU family lipid kinase